MTIPSLKWTGPATQAREVLEKHHTGSVSVKDTLIVLSESGAPTTAEVHHIQHAIVTALPAKRQRRGKKYVLDILTKLFGGFQEKIDFVPGATHPICPGSFHPDDYAAFLTIEEVCKEIVGLDNITFNPCVFSSTNLKGSFVLTGGPYSNYLSSLILQYSKISPGNQEQGLEREAEPIVRFRYQFLCNPRDLLLRGVRPVPDMEEPNWIILNTEDENNVLVPDIEKIDGKNFLRSDYLVVYVLPNFLNIEAYNEGQKLFLFSGIHGPGTMAIDLLFQDRDLLSSLDDYINKEKYCEAVFKINSIDRNHQRPQPRSLSKEIKFATPTFNDTSLRKWLSSNLPYESTYVQGAKLIGLATTQVVSIVEQESHGAESYSAGEQAKPQGCGSSHHHQPKGPLSPLGDEVAENSLLGEGEATNPHCKDNGSFNPRRISWRPSITSYSVQEKRALKFQSLEEIDRAISLCWNDQDFTSMPRAYAGGLTMIVPEDSVDLFMAKGFNIEVLRVLSQNELAPDKYERLKRKYGM